MIRRFGTLSVGVLLTLSLATGCVATGDSAQQVRTREVVTPQTPPLPTNPPSIVLPHVTGEPPQERQALVKPPPPSASEVIAVNAPPPAERSPSPTTRIASTLAETNDPPYITALRCFREKHPQEALKQLQQYDEHTQEFFLVMLPITALVSEHGLDKTSPQEKASLVDQLNYLTTLVRGPTPLSIEKMCYCRRISGYGLYKPLPEDHTFVVDAHHHGELVQLYVEPRNFVNRKSGEFYVAWLASTLEIRERTRGELVWRYDFPENQDSDHSLSPRQDYFIPCTFYVPAKLEPGEYTLTICLRDQNATGDEAQRTAKRSLPFRVGSDAAHPSR